MIKYMVNLTNPDDMERSSPVSFGTGRHGFTVRAENLAEAEALAVARARRDGFYGHDWQAEIVPLDACGHYVGGPWRWHPDRVRASLVIPMC